MTIIYNRAYFNAAGKRYRERHKLLGLCTMCSNKAEAGYTLCRKCIDRHKYYNHKRIQARRIKGLCVRCKEKAVPQTSYCAKCYDVVLNSARRQVEIRRQEHRCIACGTPLIESEGSACYACLSKLYKRSDKEAYYENTSRSNNACKF